jgi:hypothetical protein
MLTFFVDPKWRRSLPHSALLYPFWGNALTEKTPYQKALFDRHSFSTDHYGITEDPLQADMVLMPYRHNTALRHAPELIVQCHKKAREMGKLLLIDGVGDIEHPVTLSHTFVLRGGGYRFLKKDNEIIIPQFVDDLLEEAGMRSIVLREKALKPTIGFVGWAVLTPKQQVRTLFKELPILARGIFDSRYFAMRKGIYFRRSALSAIERSPSVKANVSIRSSYSGHQHTASSTPEALRSEYIQNLLQSDYGLDVRGDANASQRFFEILSLGRIPVVVDTQRNFPFERELDYSTFSFKIDFREIELLPMRLAHFHAALSPEQFEGMQKAARHAYRHFFRVDSLIQHVLKELRIRMKAPV